MKTSVILCTYNGEKYLTELFESLLNQTKKIDEIIIADDNSVDGTKDIINSYSSKFNSTSFIANNKNKGAARNFMNAAMQASGDLLFFCDQDDIWLCDKVEKMSGIMEKNKNINLLASNLEAMYTGKKSIKSRMALERQKNNENIIIMEAVAENFNIKRSGCTMCIRKEFFDNIARYWIEDWYHDDYVWKCAVLDGTAAIYSHLTVYRRIHETNASISIDRTRDKRLKYIEEEKRYIMHAADKLHIKNIDIIHEINKFVSFQNKRYSIVKYHKFFVYINIVICSRKLYRSKAQMLLDGYFLFKRKNG